MSNVRYFRFAILLVLAAALSFSIFLFSKTPSNEGPWRPDQNLLSDIIFYDDHVTITNIRDFRYAEGYLPASSDYLERDYFYEELDQIWFGLSHFGPWGLAHSFLSFEFSDGSYLVLSIEARLKAGMTFQPLAGLFRNYSLIYVFATEEDAIGVRTHATGQRVLVYPLQAGHERKVALFMDLLRDADELRDAPQFYNLIFDNCLTNLLKHTALPDSLSMADLRVLLPGRVDRLTYTLDATPADIDFQSARERATINPEGFSPDSKDFSERIRCGWHGYQGLKFEACANKL